MLQAPNRSDPRTPALTLEQQTSKAGGGREAGWGRLTSTHTSTQFHDAATRNSPSCPLAALGSAAVYTTDTQPAQQQFTGSAHNNSFIRACRAILCLEGFRSPWYKQLLFAVLGVCTGGLLFLVAKWSLTVRIVLRLKRCSLKEAQYVRTTVGASCRLLNQAFCNSCITTSSLQEGMQQAASLKLCGGPHTCALTCCAACSSRTVGSA